MFSRSIEEAVVMLFSNQEWTEVDQGGPASGLAAEPDDSVAAPAMAAAFTFAHRIL